VSDGAELDSLRTAQVCEAAGVTDATVMRWAKQGVMPAYERVFRGRRGSFARWPRHAAEQAAWVKAQLDAGRSFEEIRQALARGEFKTG
jgi:DNA-binding transcriptional MerR regulator